MGLTHYFDGTTCKRGHTEKRYVVDSACAPCKIEQGKKWRRDNIDLARSYERLAYAKDPEKFKARARIVQNKPSYQSARKKWSASNPGYNLTWYRENAVEQREKIRIRRLKNPDLYRVHGLNRRARVRGAEGTHTASDLQKIRMMQRDKCAYCRTNLSGGGQVDHIIALASGGSNWPSNLQFLCAQCNHSKNSKDPIEFARFTGRLI